MKIFKKLRDKELFKNPKEVPETAKDRFGSLSSTNNNQIKIDDPSELEKVNSNMASELPEMKKDLNLTRKSETKEVKSANTEKTADNDYSDSLAEPPFIKEPYESAKKSSDPKLEISSKQSLLNESHSFYSGEDGFFNNFEQFIKQKSIDDSNISEFMDKDLLHKMKQFHNKKVSETPFFFHKEEGDEHLNAKLSKLKSLEQEWFSCYRKVSEFTGLMHEKEAEIDLQIEELKLLLKHLKQQQVLERKAPKDNYFYFSNGQALRSIGDLREYLKHISPDIFKKHVFDNENHFADWVENVFGEKSLAAMMRNARSPESILEVLYNF